MSEIKVNKISPRTACGTTTLGDSGDTISIPAGVTITNSGTASGFGSTGEVSWDTTKISADPGPAVNGRGYFTDTSGSAFNVTLPASPSAGNVVAVADYANNWDNNNLTILRNGSNIEGEASNFVCNTKGAAITFVFVDATKGWICTNTGNSDDAFTSPFIVATGGTESTSGNCKIHTFTGPGTFPVCAVATRSSNNQVSYLVVAGGGGGAPRHAGGGGAGGFREDKSPVTPYTASPLEGAGAITVTATGFPITVGAGGPCGSSGSNSQFSTIISAGGGASTPSGNGSNGGSGGGGGGSVPGPVGTSFGGNGNTPPVSPSQGFPGAPNTVQYNGGGGGGATVQGSSPGPTAGAGGAGATTSINGSPTTFAGGGGGGSFAPQGTPKAGGAGGAGGGGAGATGNPPSGSGVAGTANTGGGGGGGGGNDGTPQPCAGGAGGSGIVIIRYKFQ